ncbi:cytochrome c biogenesis protein ResB [Desulfuromonas soudanensis]|uniref:Cytochrome c biogenesis protein ResB n=1 Tax=Desulfuromonas soudanensis TaxID=1603606 RepID=A0A0M3QFG7_9BACT|nr:cytochrome c biogenesis protein ResB [Desulfuromonas soudanensis]ALC16199.1 cytochrome c biogenesis protein ResB [Desulfuromonas soudanensis]
MALRPLFASLWRLLCSLKLAIVLAAAVTLLGIGGSLVMHFNPGVFGDLDRMILGRWWSTAGSAAPLLSWWVPVGALLLALLCLNTLCCFLDWARRIRYRWRKGGEYLIHLGFVLVLIAYFWGSLAGFRSEGNRLFVGQTLALPSLPGHFLRLEAFEPIFAENGRPVDMLSTVALLHGDNLLARQIVRTNTPLTWKGLAVFPGSFGRTVEGFAVHIAGVGRTSFSPGAELSLPDGLRLRVLNFLSDARRLAGGRVARGSSELGRPAFELELNHPDGPSWRGWYLLAEGPPSALTEAGLLLRPVEPLYRPYSILTINDDPGAALALTGGLAMLAGVLLALVSFYYKRGRGDRPEVW